MLRRAPDSDGLHLTRPVLGVAAPVLVGLVAQGDSVRCAGRGGLILEWREAGGSRCGEPQQFGLPTAARAFDDETVPRPWGCGSTDALSGFVRHGLDALRTDGQSARVAGVVDLQGVATFVEEPAGHDWAASPVVPPRGECHEHRQ